MVGGAEAALQAGAVEVQALNLPLTNGAVVVDLGAGFGTHAIPFARRGARVIAIDTSAGLLRALAELAGGMPITVVNDDLLAFRSHITEAPSAIICMGDTIAHLADWSAVEILIERVAAALPHGGTFVVSFRDFGTALIGDERFLPVQSDDTRILTCFLEYERDAVVVHDILHQRTPEGWQTRVSHYRKIRVSAEQLIGRLEMRGFAVSREDGMQGMVRLVAINRGNSHSLPAAQTSTTLRSQ